MNLILNENIIFFKERFSLIPIQRVCTNDRCLFKKYVQKIFFYDFFSFYVQIFQKYVQVAK